MPDDSQPDLAAENTPDDMDGEQTWPTEEELRQAEEQQQGQALPFHQFRQLVTESDFFLVLSV